MNFSLSGKPPFTATVTVKDSTNKTVLTGTYDVTPDGLTVPVSSTTTSGTISIPTGKQFYVAPTQLSAWLDKNKSDPNYQLLHDRIGINPTAIWLNGNDADIDLVRTTMKNCGTDIPEFVVYAIVDRDGGDASAGGFKNAADYNKWVGGLGWAVQDAGNKPCVFIIEPDALGKLNDRPNTYACINAAVDILRKNGNSKIFIEAAMWVAPNDMQGRVKGAGVERASGICVNAAGRNPTAKCEDFAKAVLNGLKPGLQYIVDTSRNGGNTKDGDWENPIGEKIGMPPKIVDSGQLYAYAWIKLPGESDGNANGGPPAGQLWIQRAVDLAK